MSPVHVVSLPEQTLYTVTKNNVPHAAHVLQRHADQVYVHYINTDKRLDEWVPADACVLAPDHTLPPPSLPLPLSGQVIAPATADATTRTISPLSGPGVAGPSTPYLSTDDDATATTSDLMTAGEVSKKRKRGRPPRLHQPDASNAAGPSSNPYLPLPHLQGPGQAPAQVEMTEEEYDIQHHKQITAQRNFDKVHFGEWQVKTWYFSPYPLTDTELDDPPPSSATQIPGVHKASARAHGRTSDLLAGGLGRNYPGSEKAMLWVCQQCFKYMADGNSYDLHIVSRAGRAGDDC
ncbi:hypothetical protein DXG03_001781 [Asterophora parasitica]|uniref:MYST-type HAT domain-containing protein n=1 Tax=Asterophora parasitica TaxID=117018 RepID=A0A9P7KA59_9AGAR|nr:hypothetical protein DXG03_001781 [Asterophora parasitica]